MKTCSISHLCPWGHTTHPQECGYKNEMKETDACYSLFNSSNCGDIITIFNQKDIK